MSNRSKKNKLISAQGIGVKIFLLALLVRLIHLACAADGPTFFTPAVDAQIYDAAARGMLAGKGWTEKFFLQGFLYPLFLTIGYGLSNGSILFVKLLQALLGAVTVVLATRISLQYYGDKAAWATGVLLCLYGPLLFFETELLATGLAAFFVILSVLLFTKAAKQPDSKIFALLGLVSALSILTRAPLIVPFFVAFIWLLIQLYRQKFKDNAWRNLRFLSFAFILFALPPALLSYHSTGKFSIFPASGGINFFVGNHKHREKMLTTRPGYEWQRIFWIPAREGVQGIWNENDYFFSKVKSRIHNDPVGFIQGLLEKSREVLSSREIPRNFDPYLFRDGNPLLSFLMWKAGGFGFPFGLILPIALLGYWVQRKKTPGVVGLYIAAYVASIVVVFVSSRYRIPVIPLLAIPFGAGVSFLISVVQKRAWKSVVLYGSFIIIIGIAISIPDRFEVEGNSTDFVVEMKLYAADDAMRRNNSRAAIKFAAEAVELQADNPQALTQLGLIRFKTDQFASAKQAFKRALAIAPDISAARVNLGIIYGEQGKLNQAIAQLNAALEINPFHAGAHANLGGVLGVKGEITEAINHLQIATELDPWLSDAYFNLALMQAKLGKKDEAKISLDKAEVSAEAEGNQQLINQIKQLRLNLSKNYR